MRLLLNHNEHVIAPLPETQKGFDCWLFTDDQTLATFLVLLIVKHHEREFLNFLGYPSVFVHFSNAADDFYPQMV